jgi:gas vesicle protein
MSEDKSSRSSTSIFLMGAAVGAVIALLYAPKSGAETRKLLAKKGKELKSRAQESIETAQEFIHDRKEDLVAAFDSAKEAGHDSKHKRS